MSDLSRWTGPLDLGPFRLRTFGTGAGFPGGAAWTTGPDGLAYPAFFGPGRLPEGFHTARPSHSAEEWDRVAREHQTP